MIKDESSFVCSYKHMYLKVCMICCSFIYTVVTSSLGPMTCIGCELGIQKQTWICSIEKPQIQSEGSQFPP